MPWFSVRCVFRTDPSTYEERITLWRAASFEVAIAEAEKEAADYARALSAEQVPLVQAFWLSDDSPPSSGSEVFSLIRESALEPTAYVASFFDTGKEISEQV
jgi:hypothetical protein